MLQMRTANGETGFTCVAPSTDQGFGARGSCAVIADCPSRRTSPQRREPRAMGEPLVVVVSERERAGGAPGNTCSFVPEGGV